MSRTEEDFIRALIDVDAKVLDNLLARNDRDFHIDDMLRDQMPALHFAVIFRRIDVVKVLLDHGAEVNLTNKEGETCLHLVVKYSLLDQNVEQIHTILKDIVVDNKRKEKLIAPFFSETKHLLRILNLLEGSLSKFDRIYYADDNEDDISLVELLLRCGANPNVQCKYWKNTPLMAYCSHGDRDIRIMDLLLEYGADVKIKGRYNNTAIISATECGNAEMVGRLLDVGAWNDLPMSRFPLHNAIYNEGTGRIRKRKTALIIKLLVERGACVDFMGEGDDNISALLAAVGVTPSIEGVKCLLSLGADPNLYIKGGPDLSDEPPLWSAVYSAEPEIAECLIKYGADVFYKDRNVATLLNAAMLDNHNHGYPKLSSSYGNRPLNCVTLLMERGVTIGERDYYSLTPEKIELLEQCQRELELLKEFRIHPDFCTTYFDFLLKRDRALVRCLRNEKIDAVMKSGDYKKKFVNFADRLQANYDLGSEQIALTDDLR